MVKVKDNPKEKGESPKRVFGLLPRPTAKVDKAAEDPKQFFRRMAALGRIQIDPPFN